MKGTDICLAILVAAIWGLAFVATEFGLESFSAPQLTALRFAIAAIPVLFLPRPKVPWRHLVVLGLFLFAGQFLMLHFGFVHGMPPGLASVVTQTQAFFTIAIAAFVLRDVPGLRQVTGLLTALAGLILIAFSVGGGLTYAGLGLTLGGAVSWAVGNILLKRIEAQDMLPLMVWLAVVPPLPALALSLAIDERNIFAALASSSWLSLGSALYLGLVATVFAYSIWGRLLRLYPTAQVAPFALLAPCTGALSAALVLGEQFDGIRLAGMALIVAGLVITVVPRRQPHETAA